MPHYVAYGILVPETETEPGSPALELQVHPLRQVARPSSGGVPFLRWHALPQVVCASSGDTPFPRWCPLRQVVSPSPGGTPFLRWHPLPQVARPSPGGMPFLRWPLRIPGWVESSCWPSHTLVCFICPEVMPQWRPLVGRFPAGV